MNQPEVTLSRLIQTADFKKYKEEKARETPLKKPFSGVPLHFSYNRMAGSVVMMPTSS